MKTKIKRVLSFLLLVTVCVTNIQFPALAAETYSVTVADTEHGKVLLNGEEKDINLEKGTEVIISAVPAEGYKLESIAAIKEDGSENGLKEVENGYVTQIQDSNVTVETSFTRDATTSDLEALFGPKEGEEDTRLSAKAWKQTQKAQETDRSAYTDYTASRQWYDVTIGTNDDGGNIIWQWTEGMLYVGGRLTFCMDAKTSFYEGVEYTPTDASALGLSQTEVTRLALYQEYIYNQRTDLDELGKYMFSQMLMWRELNEYFSWGWPNIHIFDAGYWWADVSYQDQVLREAVEWVTEQQQSGRYTGHGEFFVHSYSQAQAIFWLEENTGGLELYKKSKKPEITDGNSAYSLAGAQYGVYRDGGDYVTPDAVITTDENGYGWVDGLLAGNYWIKELVAPKGYALDPSWSSTTVAVPGGSYGRYYTSDMPINDPVTIALGKVDADKTSGMTEAELKKLEGAQFEVKYYAVDPNAYNSDPSASGVKATRTWVLQTKYDNTKKSVVAKMDPKYLISGDEFFHDWSGDVIFPIGVITIKEIKAPKGYLVNDEVFVRKVTEDGADNEVVNTYNAPIVEEVAQKMQIHLQKVDKETGKAEAQGTGTLKGAVYEVKDTAGKTVDTLTTDAAGKATSKELPIATYTVKETKASNGYILDEKTYTVKGEATDSTTRVFRYDVKSQETPQKVQIRLKKTDSENGTAQGTATLKGAVYEVRNSNNTVVDTLTTNESGNAISKKLPLDVYTVKETKASYGYLLDEKTYTIEGNATDTTTQVFQYKVNSKEAIIRGNVEIIKLKENEDEDNDTLQGLEGVEFTFTSKTSGKKVLKITTDKYGFATTASKENPRGGLVYDTYIITETKCPEGLKPIEPFEVTIKDEGVTLKGIYKEDKLIVSPITVVKIDASTGKVIPVKNTEFRLLDSEKNPITMTTYYPNKVVHETFKTDENGQFTFPEKLKYGTYYLEELHAPEGYLNGELLQFKVTDGATWENPLVVQYADENAMGKIKIQKTDAETQSVLANAVFEITAAEDIVTPDGTVRLQKGEVADTITTNEEGKAESKALFLGKYIVKEKQQPNGYLLNQEDFSVELKYKDQETALVYKNVSVTNTPTRIQLFKTDKETKQPMAGVEFAVWNKAMAGEDQDMALVQNFVTDKDGKINIKRLAPGTYCFQETKTVPGYVLDEKIYEVTIDKDGLVEGKKIGKLEITNIPTKLIGTTARDQQTQTHEAVPKKETTFVDTVEFKNLQIGQEYTIKGVLMDKATGEPLLIHDKEVTAETTFTAEKTDGTVDVVFTFDASALKGHSIVVFEKVFIGEKEILAHEDIHDKEQTITFPNSEIKTTAVDKDTQKHEGHVRKETTIVDTVSYKNLIIGQEYTVKGTLMNKESGKPFMVNDKKITAEKTFKPEKSKGSITLEFVFDSSALKGKSVVVFEKLFAESTEVAVHEDISDVKQTVSFPDSKIETTAVDKDTQMHEGLAKKETTIVDTVSYKGLIPGEEYTVKGTLMSKETGEALLIDEKPVTAEKTFQPEKADGTVDLEFTFDSSVLKGKTVVVFEKVYRDELEVAVHADIEDREQSVSFPEIHTNAIDRDTKTHETMPKQEAVIVDTVTYKNLSIGQEYTLKGILMDKETGEPLLINGEKVVSEATFLPNQSDGSVDVEFAFDASALKGKSVVVFERLSVKETEVAVHTDITDEGQTITFLTPPEAPPVKTGDSNGIPGSLIALLFGSAAVIGFILYRKKKQA